MITSLSQLDFDKQYTYADYLTWQFEERVELINGLIYPMERSGGTNHQRICGALLYLIHSYLKKNPLAVIYHIPFDVRLSSSFKNPNPHQIDTVVQPDLSIICDKTKLDEWGCNGTPDWIIEILSFSESMNKKDLSLKFDLYQSVGVREYWIVNPNDSTVRPYRLDDQSAFQPIRNTPFAKGEKIPIGVFEGFGG